jgi:hypothetical protein
MVWLTGVGCGSLDRANPTIEGQRVGLRLTPKPTYRAGRLHILCFVFITNDIRVISFRKANTREARKYGKPITID